MSFTKPRVHGDITYTGDGELHALFISSSEQTEREVTITGGAIEIESFNSDVEGYVLAEETDNYAPAWCWVEYARWN